jgi:predicted Zn finger-like uncharacterized protein
MKFVCDRCQTKYSIPDERVRGKVLKVKCKTCANVIVVREARRASSAGLPTLSAAARPHVGNMGVSGANLALDIPIETPDSDSERTQLATYPPDPFAPSAEPFPDLGALSPPAHPSAPRRRLTGQLAAVDAVDDHVQWYLALDGARTGPFSRQKLVDKLMPLAKNADVHIWNERLGDWKPPADVAEVAGEIARRRGPPAPPPLPGAPRRPTPPPLPSLAGLAQGLPGRKPTPHAPPSPVTHGQAGAGSKLPPPSGVHPVLAARGADHGGDPSSLLETPAPMPHMAAHPLGHALAHATKTNGVGASGTHAPPRPVNSDVLQMLNLPGGTQTAPGAPPRLLSLTETMAATGMAPPAPRSRSAMYIVGLLGVIGVVVVLVVVNLKKPPKPAAIVVQPPPVTAPVEPVAAQPVEPPPPVVAPVEPPPPTKGKRGVKPTRAVVTKTTPAPTTTTVASNTGAGAAAGGGDAARFRDNHTLNITGGGIASRPPPAQADITKVISNNRAGIKVCYQRALTRDNSLTHGKLAVKLSIGISGRVKHVGLDGPSQFKLLLEPCIKEVVQRWVFPQASEEYGTEFPLVFQGNE